MPHSQVIPGETSVIILDRNGRIECTGTGAQRLLFETMTDAFVSVSMDGWIIDSNKAYQQLTGYNQDELSRLSATREILLATRRISPGAVEFSVSDIGPGIHPDHLPNILGLFFTTKDSGTGVGLALAHRIVTSHGGTIIAANHKDRPGAYFCIRLPTNGTLP